MFEFRKKVICQNNKKVIFLICGWPGKIWNYYLTVKILEINGYQSMVYEYDDKDMKEVILFFASVQIFSSVFHYYLEFLRMYGVMKKKKNES